MITIIKNYLYNLYIEKINYMIIKIENSLIPNIMELKEYEVLSSEENDYSSDIKKIIKLSFEDFLTQGEEKTIIEKIIEYVNEKIINKYHNNEFNLRIQ